jgi:hypothetical protein
MGIHDESKVHVYRPREDRLLQLVFFLWNQLTHEQQEDLTPDIEAAEMGWAIPSWERRDADDWLTAQELAVELGMTVKGVRNWQSRYGLTPVRGRFRWGDVEDVKRRKGRQSGKATA